MGFFLPSLPKYMINPDFQSFIVRFLKCTILRPLPVYLAECNLTRGFDILNQILRSKISGTLYRTDKDLRYPEDVFQQVVVNAWEKEAGSSASKLKISSDRIMCLVFCWVGYICFLCIALQKLCYVRDIWQVRFLKGWILGVGFGSDL